MYICLGCGRIFDEPAEWEEKHGFTHGPFEHWSGCPFCYDGYEELVECKVCGEYVPVSQTTDGVCDNCYEEEDEDEDEYEYDDEEELEDE